MRVERRSLLGGAADASGIAVVIDVLRAFTCSALMFRFLLIGTPYDHLRAVWECMADAEIAASLRAEHDFRPREDIILALQRDLLDFVMIGHLEGGHVRVTRQNIR